VALSDTYMSESVQQVVHELLGHRKLDAKTVQYWEQCISNKVSTLEDFRSSIYLNPVYKEVVLENFNKVLTSLGIEGNARMFDDFQAQFIGRDATIENAQMCIARSSEFIIKYSQIIGDMMTYELGTPDHTDTDVSFYLSKFNTMPGYNITSLANDIQSNAHVTTDVPIRQLQQVVQKAVMIPERSWDKDSLDAFENVFQRAMYVQEYFKYVGVCSGDWNAILAKHTTSYNRLREIFETFTGKTISEYYFVNKFLDGVDDITFFDNIVDTIVESPDYTTSMKRILAEKYKTMFDMNLEESDIDYVFQIVKNQKIDIVNEKLTDILTQLKVETDEVVSHVFKQFLKILERPPDLYDIEQYIRYYRDRLSEGYDALDGKLERILMHTLEFHDIIKKKIKSVYSTKKGKDILPSMMFDVLNRVIVKVDKLTMTNINDVISDLLV